MKPYADEKWHPYPFAIGDKVWLKLHPYRQHSVEHWRYQKISKKWYGPFAILKKINDVAFHLQLPEGTTIFQVFHAALLKPFKGTEAGKSSLELPPLAVDTHPLAGRRKYGRSVKSPNREGRYDNYWFHGKEYQRRKLAGRISNLWSTSWRIPTLRTRLRL